ncbi:serine/threonine-protein kinase-like protein GIN4 [Cucurbitaria berberidis CBS 394.84]|uniref:non-specific serine/threonine protein kinase n=1 Tax=Cucurbitaria berberidis CBS 394.84 TaxID=1168544 RepID=A0A9P4GVF4_9PLEO|nr:serine/threonine-protein kinase-like protein GIN4 [Cucurbitaria berberidis CBS 394.84]KAF1851741.1 serine/threonine-protein kinase-like protein GIN4 [Cucurbitaria berberidis CBS 394.84]
MDSAYHGRPPTRRRALGDASSRANESNNTQRRGDKYSSDYIPSSSPNQLPHNESIVPNGTLAVSQEQPSPENKRLSAVLAHEARPHNPKRDSNISNASTNASNTTRRRKTHIGPWQLGRTIGRGGCSRVRLVRHSGTGQYGAAKIISKATAEKVRALSLANLIQSAEQDPTLYPDGKVIPFGLEREICIMKLLDHPNIVRLYDIWENHNELYLIMEFIEGGELFSYIHEQGGLIEIHTVHIFRQIIAALIYCHRINIHHRDLKPENILLDRETMTVKLVDFGMAALQPTGKKLTTPCGSPHYAAPEVIKTISYDGAKADVWSCGVILYVLLTGTPPFNYSGEDRHLKNLFQDIAAAKYVMPDGLSREAQDLIKRILVVDPKRRIGLDEIWNHPFLRKYQHELNFVGENTSQDHWTGPLPAIAEWTTLERTTIDREILRYLRTLWHSEREEVLIQRLMSTEANQEKYFYSALRKYHTDQLENYQPSAHHPVVHSKSDHHHNTRHSPTPQDLEKLPSKKHKRTQSGYSILNNEHLYSKHSFYESPVSEASYDPFRASRQPMIPEQAIVHQNVTVHRGPSSPSRRPRPAASMGHRTGSSLRIQALRNSKRSSAMSRGSSNRSTPSRRSISIKQRSVSRSSLASSHWPSSPPVVARSGGLGRRGVSFSHLRDRRSSVATASTFETDTVAYADYTSSHRPHTSIGSYGSSLRSSTARQSPAFRSKSRGPASIEAPRLKIRKPESPTKYIQGEARKVSMELGKVMEEAFNRSSISSSIRTTGTGTELHRDISQYDTPPTSFSNTRDSGGSTLATPNTKAMLAQRPLPPIPAETPNTFLQRKLAETRAEIARRLDEDGDNTEHFNEVLEHLDRLIVPGAHGKRTVSAPPKSPEHPAPLHVIPEEADFMKSDGGDGFETYSPHYRAVTDPISLQSRRAVTEQQTIRLVNDSPTRVAPLNIRKRSGASIASKAAKEASAVPWPGPIGNTPVRSYQDVQNDLLAARTNEVAPTLEKQNTVIKKKKSLWFRRNTEEKDQEQEKFENQVKKKQSTILLQIPVAWQGLDDRIKNDAPQIENTGVDINKHTQKYSEASNGSEFPMRNSNIAAAKSDGALRKGFFGLFGKKTKEEKGKKPMELGAVNFSSSSILSAFDLGPEHNNTNDNTVRTGPPEMQMNWLSRFLHIKPACHTLCFHIGRGKVRQDLVRLLRDWQRFGVRDVSLDRETNVINARVDKNNHLKIKPVSFVIELFVVLEHGRRASLCLARFTQTRGAASSFRKVVDIVEDVCRARAMLVEDEEKKAAMMEVLD